MRVGVLLPCSITYGFCLFKLEGLFGDDSNLFGGVKVDLLGVNAGFDVWGGIGLGGKLGRNSSTTTDCRATLDGV
jgi:hypothetical protein